MDNGLRSNFTPGSTRWAVRRAQWSAMGISPADQERPKVAVVNTSSQLSVCFSHLDEVARRVCAAVRQAGGLPFEIRTTAPSDFVTSAGRCARYLMPSRDLVVNDVEAAVEGAVLDGVVFLSSCDKTTPAHLMAAARLDLPSIVVVGGYQRGGSFAGCSVDIDTVYESVGAVAGGSMSVEELGELADAAIEGPGVCAGLATANTMHCLAEALGMTMPGSAPVRAGSAAMWRRAEEAGARIVAMIGEGLTARRVLTAEAIENAVEVALALGGSVNCVRHLAAVAAEAELDLDVVALVERLGRDAVQLAAIRPNGPHQVWELEEAGGVATVLRALLPRLHRGALTVSGRTVGELAAVARPPDGVVLREPHDPVRHAPGLAILRGSLAPDGAIVKLAGVKAEAARRFEGPARVFGSEEDALDALAAGRLRPGEVIVLRGLGVRGGPGTVFAAGFVAALNGAGLSGQVAVVTDGELSGLNHGRWSGRSCRRRPTAGRWVGWPTATSSRSTWTRGRWTSPRCARPPPPAVPAGRRAACSGSTPAWSARSRAAR